MASEPARVVDDDGVVVSAHRSRELHWRRTHGDVLRSLAGEWVVLEGEELVCHGVDPVRVVAESRERGVAVPYLFFVEPDDGRGKVRFGL